MVAETSLGSKVTVVLLSSLQEISAFRERTRPRRKLDNKFITKIQVQNLVSSEQIILIRLCVEKFLARWKKALFF